MLVLGEVSLSHYCHVLESWVSHVVQAGYFLEDDQQLLSPCANCKDQIAYRVKCFVYVLLQLSVELPPESMEEAALAAVHHSPACVTNSRHRMSREGHW